MNVIRYYISDQHFFNAQFYAWRGFASLEDMDNSMVRRWNSRVQPEDTVYILGDFSEGSGTETNALLQSLTGSKILLQGNHDDFLMDPAFDRSLFSEICSYLEIRDGNYDLVLSHYPIPCYNGQYRETREPGRKTWMLYGHVHNSYDEVLLNDYIQRVRREERRLEGVPKAVTIPCNMINCFCRFADYMPLTLEEWIRTDALRRENFKHMDYF